MYVVRPLSDRTWLRPHSKREPTRFRSSWVETQDQLEREVKMLHGANLVIEVDLRPQDLKLNGEIRANAREAETPGVIVMFTTKTHGDLVYRCDTYRADYAFQGPHWQHNVRAIAKTLEALRAVDRYGATDTGQQYTGFKALPAGRAMPASHMTRSAAAELLERIAVGDEGNLRVRSVEMILADSELATETWRHARAMVHPDRRGGDRTLWDQVEQAAAVLGVAS